MHLTAAQGWLELGNHEEAFEELEQIDAPLRGHPDVLKVRWGIYASIEKWDYCLEIGSAMVRLDPRTINASHSISAWAANTRMAGYKKPTQAMGDIIIFFRTIFHTILSPETISHLHLPPAATSAKRSVCCRGLDAVCSSMLC